MYINIARKLGYIKINGSQNLYAKFVGGLILKLELLNQDEFKLSLLFKNATSLLPTIFTSQSGSSFSFESLTEAETDILTSHNFNLNSRFCYTDSLVESLFKPTQMDILLSSL